MQVFHLTGPMPYYTNCYLLVGEDGHAVVVDPAASMRKIDEVLEREHAQLTHILLTHGHMDHVGSVATLRKKYGAKLYMCAEDALGNGMMPLKDLDVPLEEDDVIQVDDMTFRVWRTPGHTMGSCCIQCRNLLFTGDTLFQMSIGRTDLEGGDPALMMESLAKVRDLPLPDETQVLPGHMDFSTLGAERRQNPYLITL